MKISMVLLIAILIYGIFFLWPLKKRIYRKNGRILSNIELLELANQGDFDAKKLKRMTKYFFMTGALFVIFFVLEKNKFIDF